jgi:hypothetical protein
LVKDIIYRIDNNESLYNILYKENYDPTVSDDAINYCINKQEIYFKEQNNNMILKRGYELKIY